MIVQYRHVNGVDLAYREAGAGPALLLLHAFPLSGEMWEPQIEALAPVARVIAPDHRGFGNSGLPAPPVQMDTYAADAEALLEELHVESAIVAGLSMGGCVAFALYRRDARRVRGLILAATRAEADTEDGRKSRAATIELVRRDGATAIADQMIPRLLGETTMRDRPAIAHAVRRMIEGNQVEGIAAALQALADRPDSVDLLRRITAPALVLVGREDVITPEADAQLMQARLYRARLERIPGAGHLSNLEQPEQFNELVRGFIDEITRV